MAVKLQGAGKGVSPGWNGGELSLPDATTAAELLGELASRSAEPLRSELEPKSSGLPRRMRLFVDGELVHRPDQPLARAGAGSARVMVVLATPISGGS